MNFPKRKKIESILKELKDINPTLVIDFKNASKVDILKYQLCQEFVKIIKSEKITQTELAKKIGVDKAIINKIILHKIESFTIDRLMDLLSKVKSFDLIIKAS